MLLEFVYNKLQKEYSMELLAGANGLKKSVSWFHILEDSSSLTYLHGNELVFTTGVLSRGNQWLRKFTDSCITHLASGLIVNTGPYIASVPKDILNHCENIGFPVFIIPWRIKLVDITRSLSRLIIEDEKKVLEINHAFKNALLNTGSADKSMVILSGLIKQPITSFTIAVFGGGNIDNISINDIQNQLNEIQSLSYCFRFNQKPVIVFVNMEKASLSQIIHHLNKKVFDNVNIGISEANNDFKTIHYSFSQAEYALKHSISNKQPILEFDSLGLYKVLFHVDNHRGFFNSYVTSVLGEIIAYDKENHTDYLDWLAMYIECNGSIHSVAERAYCHRNTVNLKIKKIREQFKIDTSSYEQIAEIAFALAILKETASSPGFVSGS